MPFDLDKFHGKATRGDVAGVALKVSMALTNIVYILGMKQNDPNADVLKELKEVRKDAKELHEMFDELTGWSPEE